MKITATKTNGKSVVSIHGDLRVASVADARTELVAMLATAGAIELDLSDLGECDSAGIQLLLMTRASARAKGKRFATIGHTASFRATLDRIGIGIECLELQTVAPGNGQGDG
jgi:anti-anti-sigma factor